MIPVAEPLLSPEAAENVADCVRTGWISSSGDYLVRFEHAWANYCDMQYGVAVSNGTTALQIAMKCLRLESGSEVIMPSFTIISCAIAVIEAGCVPVLVDCDADTWCMKSDEVAQKITDKTRAIMAVHMFGHPVDMDPIIDLAERHNLYVIEDAAEAHGALYKGRKAGGLGHVSCFSFYANKLITTGEGGMVLTNDAVLADRLRSLRNLGFQSSRRFYHTEIGYNYRMTNLQAAIGVSQVSDIEKHVEIKRRNAEVYRQRLSRNTLPFRFQSERQWARSVYWMFGVVLDRAAGMTAVQFASQLRERGVETRPFFLGMHEQPILHDMGLCRNESHPVTEVLSEYALYLPSGLGLTERQIDAVCAAVDEVFV